MAGEEKHIITLQFGEEMKSVLDDLQVRRGKESHLQILQEAVLYLRVLSEPGVNINIPEDVCDKYGIPKLEENKLNG